MSHDQMIDSSLFQEVSQREQKSGWWRTKILKQLAKLSDVNLVIADEFGVSAIDSSISGEQDILATKIVVKDRSFYRRVCLGGTMAVAETYMEGLWTCSNLFNLFRMFARQRDLVEKLDGRWTRWSVPFLKMAEWMRSNTLSGSRENIAHHYDLGNDFFELFLDPTLTYSSAIFEESNLDKNLQVASIAKCDRMCRMVELKKTDHLVEIGSGWGSLAIHAATHYGCRVTTITLSKEQKKYAEARILARGVSHLVEVKLVDYRELDGEFDKLISIEMIEAVGHEYIGEYFKTCASLLKPKGIAAVQAITVPDQAYADHLKNVDFIQKYIFPGSKIPCVSMLLEEAKKNSSFVMSDLKDITLDYAETMLQWRQEFVKHLDQVRDLGYDDKFIKMWDYYLNYCAAGFTERYLGTVQLQFRKL
jgi:cyclopropane-fatty-acyl-phospholipid synthase